MNYDKFYGTEKVSSLSYLEFGGIDFNSSKKLVWDFKIHQKAYDWYMHARYSNDIFYYMTMLDHLGELSLSAVIEKFTHEVHHADDFSMSLSKLIALGLTVKKIQSAQQSFFELGQTLFGCIEAMEFCQALMRQTGVDFTEINLRNVEWCGVDISDFFNKLALIMHNNYTMYTFDTINSIVGIKDVFFAKGVTLLYAIRDIEQLFSLLDTGRICLFDYSFSLEEEQEIVIGSGKVLKYLKFNDFVNRLKGSPRALYLKKGCSFVDKGNVRITIDCLYADEHICRKFVDIDVSVRRTLCAKLGASNADILLDQANGRNSGWLTLEQFLEENLLCDSAAQDNRLIQSRV